MTVPEGYLLRPATAADRLQIHRLLQNFDRESHRLSHRWRRLGWSLTVAVLLWMTVSLGMAALLLTIVSLITSILWMRVSPLLSNDWKQYWIVVDCEQAELIACAKLCRYRRYSLLFNLLVAPAHRRCGLGSVLVNALSQKAVKPLYLACYPDRVSFHTRLGFKPVAAKELSAIVRNDLGITPHSNLLVLKLEA